MAETGPVCTRFRTAQMEICRQPETRLREPAAFTGRP